MNSLLKTFLALLSAAVLLLASVASAQSNSDELETVRKKVSETFAAIEPGDVFESNIDGWYTIRKGAVIAYISGDGRYLLQGDVIDLEQQVNLTEQDRNTARRDSMAEYTDDDLIVFAPENVQHTVSVFTDIDCTYCRRLHDQIDGYMRQGIKVRYFLYPRNGPASPSWSKAENVWCASDRNAALTAAKSDRTFVHQQCDSDGVSQQYTVGQDIGLTGTPAIVLEDGTLISGYLPPQQLAAAIAQNAEAKD